MTPPDSPRRKFVPWIALLLWGASLLIISGACSLGAISDDVLQATLVALRVQQTSLALTETSIVQAIGAPVATELSGAPPQMITGTAPAPPQANPPVAIVATVAGFPDERLLKSARILLFEDMSASRHVRLVKEALDEAGYFYLDVGSAKGWFKTQLLSSEPWDLVIAAGEADRDFGGELFEYIDDRVAGGAAAIVETWDLDKSASGRAGPLLDRCGVRLQSDWYDPDLRVFFWLTPDNPLISQPNPLTSGIRTSLPIWSGDVGDLLEVKIQNNQPAADAVLIAGANPEWKTDHGVLAQCLGGRLILQTFRTHDFRDDDMVKLWQNYVYHVLKARFVETGANLPTPVATVLPSPQAGPTLPGPTPGPEYIFEHTCGGLMAARLTAAPRFQNDLFEHHALGEFLLLSLELDNRTDFPIQVWDDDYRLEALLNSQVVSYPVQKAATGYLYLEGPGQLWQDLIQPGQKWRTRLVFDVDTDSYDWTLVVRPGSEFNEQVCEVRIPLVR